MILGDAHANTRTRACFGNVRNCLLVDVYYTFVWLCPIGQPVNHACLWHMEIHRLELSNTYMLPPCGTRALKSCNLQMGPLKEARTPTEPTEYGSPNKVKMTHHVALQFMQRK